MTANEVVTYDTGSAASSVVRVFSECIEWNAARYGILVMMHVCMVALRAIYFCV